MTEQQIEGQMSIFDLGIWSGKMYPEPSVPTKGKTSDILHIEEYPDRYVGGSYDFEGVVVIENGRAMVTYLDIGESEGLPISMFPIEGRQIYPEKWRYDYWKTIHLGGEPPEYLWKEELYRDHFDTKKQRNLVKDS